MGRILRTIFATRVELVFKGQPKNWVKVPTHGRPLKESNKKNITKEHLIYLIRDK